MSKKKTPIPPTWPRTKDQRNQTRPVIVVRPLRALRRAMLDNALPDKEGIRSLTAAQRSLLRALRNEPRHYIEQALAAQSSPNFEWALGRAK